MMTTLDKIQRQAQECPDKIAYRAGGDSITYGELCDRARRYARLLQKQGDSPVIIYGGKSVGFVVAMIACLTAGRAYVPIDSFTPMYRLKKIAALTAATLIITDSDIKLDDAVCCDPGGLEQFDKCGLKPQKADTAYIIFTSGTTGDPKGVPISRGNLDNFVGWISALDPLCDYKNISVLNQASFSFDLSVADLYYSLCNGHTLVSCESGAQAGFDAVFGAFEEVDVAVLTPTFIKLCLLDRDFNKKRYPRLKCVCLCGEPLEAAVVNKLFAAFEGIKVINAYGPTEATCAVCATQISHDDLTGGLLPVGDVGGAACEIEISDGEIVLKGKSVFGGYLGNERGGFFREGETNCYKTGDLGYIENGKLYCQGRRDSQIKYKGYRIELGDVERNIGCIDGVKECAVIAVRGGGAVKTVKGYVVADGGVTPEFIKRELQKKVPSYMVPRSIKIIDRLPVNGNGKLDRKALSEL